MNSIIVIPIDRGDVYTDTGIQWECTNESAFGEIIFISIESKYSTVCGGICANRKCNGP